MSSRSSFVRIARGVAVVLPLTVLAACSASSPSLAYTTASNHANAGGVYASGSAVSVAYPTADISATAPMTGGNTAQYPAAPPPTSAQSANGTGATTTVTSGSTTITVATATTTPASTTVSNVPDQTPEPSHGETYAHATENGFVDTTRDTLATLSLDVDTGSYTIMRRDITAGALPPSDSVRVEEYLNFFNYGEQADTATSEGAPFSVHTEASPSPFGARGTRLLRVGVNTVPIHAAQRPATNLVFLVDVSGSMGSPDKLPLVQYSLSRLVESLRPQDTIGIVVYAGSDAVLLPPTAVSSRAKILSAIEGLQSGGGTNGAAGIRTAYDLASQYFKAGGINRVFLCTDGDFNIGLTGDDLIHLIEQQRTRGITLSTLGFGSGNYNDRDMERLADHGNGNYAYIDSPQEALRVLSKDLASTLQVVAKDVKIQMSFDPHAVKRFRLVGYENRVLDHQDFANDHVDAAEVGSGDSVTALFEYEPAPNATASLALGEVRVRWKAPEGDRSTLQVYPVGGQVATRFETASAPMRMAASVAEFAEVLRHSQHASGADFASIASIAQGASASLPSDDAREFVTLVQRAATLWPAATH